MIKIRLKVQKEKRRKNHKVHVYPHVKYQEHSYFADVESCCTVLGLPCLFKEDIKHILMTDVEYQTSEEVMNILNGRK